MTKIPVLRAREVVAVLLKTGFIIHHQKGSHVRLRRSGRPTLFVTVPCHSGDVPLGTLRRIIEQAGLTTDEFRDLM